MNTNSVIWSKTLMPGDRWSGSIGKGKIIRFTAMGDGANLAMLMYNFYNLSEHYNAPDTMKAQHTFFLTKGHAIISDMGRALASIVDDTVCNLTSGSARTIGFRTLVIEHRRDVGNIAIF